MELEFYRGRDGEATECAIFFRRRKPTIFAAKSIELLQDASIDGIYSFDIDIDTNNCPAIQRVLILSADQSKMTCWFS